MHFAALILYTLSAAVLGAATPVETKEEPRGTCLQYPPAYGKYQITQTVKPVVTFQVPANSPGPCSLVAKFPAGYPIGNYGYTLVNAFAIGGPAPGALVGTFRFNSSPSAPTFVTVNSFACRQVMSYRLEIADSTRPGSVSFTEAPGAGLFMIAGDPC